MWVAHRAFAKVLQEKGGRDSDQTTTIFGVLSCTRIGKSLLVVRASALLWDRVVLVKGSLHSEVDYDNG